jgi:hypothetical protein
MPRKFEERYRQTLRRRVVEDYIKENNRSPSRAQVNELIQNGAIQYPGLNTVGFSSVDFLDIEPDFMKVSSSSDENEFRFSGYDDLISIDQKVDDLLVLVEDTQRGFKATSTRVKKLLRKIDRRLNNLLILSGRTDAFVYGVEEAFETHDAVNLELTDATVESGYVTLGRKGYSKLNLTEAEFTVTPIASKGIIGTRNIGGVPSIKEMDGSIWEYHVETNYSIGKVGISININFDNPSYVGDLRVTGNSIDSNALTTFRVFYSIDGKTFEESGYGRQDFGTGENQISIGIENILAMRIVLEKDAADHSDSEVKHRYIFNVDSLEIFTDQYEVNQQSVLYCGPYRIFDESGDPVNFTMATLGTDTCCTVPRKSSVSFFLSKDNTTWMPASFTGDSLSVVYFNTTNPVGTYAYVDSSKNEKALSDTASSDVDLEFGKDLVCNLYISEDYSDGFVLRNTVVKRNLPQGNMKLYGAPSGWFIDQSTYEYICAFKIDDIQGRIINLGNTSAYLDGRQVTGQVHVPEGYHTFRTSNTNWHDVAEDLKTHSNLEEADPSYPFNHKLIIEGYHYPSDFQGERIYEGVDEYFGYLLEYVSPEKFEQEENDGNLFIYTIENYDGRLYFKVKADPSDGSWFYEHVKVDYMLRTEDTSDLYIKAIISTRDKTITPNIHSISVRVV